MSTRLLWIIIGRPPTLRPRQVHLLRAEWQGGATLQGTGRAGAKARRRALLVLILANSRICEFRSGLQGRETLKKVTTSLSWSITEEIASVHPEGAFSPSTSLSYLSAIASRRSGEAPARSPTITLQAPALRMQKVHLHGDFGAGPAPRSCLIRH